MIKTLKKYFFANLLALSSYLTFLYVISKKYLHACNLDHYICTQLHDDQVGFAWLIAFFTVIILTLFLVIEIIIKNKLKTKDLRDTINNSTSIIKSLYNFIFSLGMLWVVFIAIWFLYITVSFIFLYLKSIV